MRNFLLLCLAVFSFGIAQAQDCTGADHTVLAGSFYYTPSTLTVTAGETIAFVNEAGFHNVNGTASTIGDTWNNPESFSLGANSGTTEGACMGTISLTIPGTYNYDSSIGSHAAAGMVGTIIVEAASSTTPTDNAADPTLDAGDVVSVYGGSYDNIASNYNPGWGQSGTVNTEFDPGTGNSVMEYANFNYQGTDLVSADLSGMTHLHLDVWVAADNDRMLKVTPVNGGTGAGEFLVEVPLTPGSWNSVDLTKASFEGMSWDNVFQMKFDGQFNADGSANGAGWDVYYDNLYFWNDGTGSGPPSGETADVTFNVNTANITVGPNGMYVGGGDYFGGAQGNAMSDPEEDGIWTVTIAVPVGYSGNYVYLNSPNDNGDWNAKENLIGLPCANGPYNDRLLAAVNEDITLSTCFGQCTTDGTCESPATEYAVTFQVDMANAALNGDETIYVTGSLDGWCGPCDNVLTDTDGDNVYTGVVNLVPGDYEFKYMINAWGGDEQNIGGTACDFVPTDNNGNRGFTLGEADMVLDVQCFDYCGTCDEQNNEGGGGGGGDATPTDNAADPTLDAGDVVSVYGGSYDNIASNYNPGWGQSGTVNTEFDPGTGNSVMEYANFNYQGTDLVSADLSGMTHLHLDVWVAADNDRMLKVTPVNGGTGAGEFLVEVPLTPGSWNSVDLTKASFEGMSWDNVFQMKFDGQFNADGSANGAGWDVYYDNLYFWNDGTGSGPPSGETADVTFNVNTANITVGPNGMYVGGGDYFGGAQGNAMSDPEEDGIWTVTIAVPVGYSGNYVYLNSPNDNGDWNAKENLIGLPCANGPYNDRLLAAVNEDITLSTCFGQCTTDGTCESPATEYAVTFQVDMANAALNGDETIYVTGSLDGWCGPCDNVLTDTDGDNVYTGVVNLVPGDYEFKYMINAWGGDEQNIGGTACDFVPTDNNGNRGFTLGEADMVLDVQCFDYCGTCDEQNNQETVDITWTVNMSNEEVSTQGVFLAGGGNFGNPGDNPLTDNGDGTWTITQTVPSGFSSFYIFTNGACGDYSCKEQLGGLPCGVPANFNDRQVVNITEDTTFNFCFGECGTDGNCEGGNGGGGGGDGPTDNAADPAQDASNVISVYSGSYDDIATNYNPGWGQSGSVNPEYDPGTGNLVLAYTNFNYQGTDLAAVNASAMEFLHIDIWVAADSDRLVKVSPINNGDGAGEFLVEVPVTPGSWNSVDLPKSAFEGMTWDNVFQMKFDGQFNSDGSANAAPQDIYLDNIYFYSGAPSGGGDVAVTFSVDMNNYGGSFDTLNVSGTWNNFCGTCNAMTDEDEDGIWTTTIELPEGANYRYKYQVDAWSDQEDLAPGDNPIGPCVVKEGGFTNRDLDVIGGGDMILDTVCWGTCLACVGANDVAGCNDESASNYDSAATANDGSCVYSVTLSVNMNEYALAATDTVHLNGEFTLNGDAWCGTCNPMSDDDEDGVWTLTLDLPSDYYEYKFTVNGWNAQENLAGLSPCVTENFGFTNRVLQLFGNQSEAQVCWNSCSDCEGTGEILGCTDSGAVNYSAAATSDDGSCEYNVTFQVDMSSENPTSEDAVYVHGSFVGWCGVCVPMTDDDEDGIYTVTVVMAAGDAEYKFKLNDGEETLTIGAPCDFNPNDTYANRGLTVSGDATLDVVCYSSCYACDVVSGCTNSNASNYNADAIADDGSCLFTVTLRLDMNLQEVSASGVHVAGSFQGWTPGSTMMTSPGLDLYEYTLQVAAGAYQFIYINGNDWPGQETVPAECGVDNGLGGYNREFVVAGDNLVLDVVCFSSCTACAGCTDPLSAEFSPWAGEDDGSCATDIVFGCTYNDADNYSPSANMEDGTCEFSGSSSCPTDIDGDGSTAVGDLLVILGAFGQICE